MQNRRSFLAAGATLGFASLSRRAACAAGSTSKRLCMAEDLSFFQGPIEKIQRRFDLYRQLGFGTLRASIAWRHLEVAPGVWNGEPLLQPHLARRPDGSWTRTRTR
jgi:hypothetical protein